MEPGSSTNDFNDFDGKDTFLEDLVSRPVFPTESFNIPTGSGHTIPPIHMINLSLHGLSNVSSSPKSYKLLKLCLGLEKSEVICESPFSSSVEYQNKLESVVATLSDAQFSVLTRMLACSPKPRHLMYLGICAMLPQDLNVLKRCESIRRATGASESAIQTFLVPANKYLHPKIPNKHESNGMQVHSQGISSVFIKWSIDDLPGARDLLLKTVLYLKGVGSGMNPSNISVLQRFASLSEVVSRELTLRWRRKWPLNWEGVDGFMLDVTSAYGPDGVFLPTARMLQDLTRDRGASPHWFKIVAPDEVPEGMLYQACGYEYQDFPSQRWVKSLCGH